MKRLQWWMRIVGGFYLLLTLMNCYFLFVNPRLLADNLPEKYSGNELAGMAFADAWMVFVFEFGVLGAMLLYGARNPLGNKILIWTVILAELTRGILADLIWILRGYSASDYIVFMVIHLIIIITGWLFLRQAGKESK